MLELGRKHNFKLVFKEKHDVWGVLPSDPDVQKKIFKPEYRDLIVPLYSTNQIFQPEVQWGGMLGLKQSGWFNEFGMSTQYWNYGEWGAYTRDEVLDLNTSFVCPADIQLRLELLGGALGGTWFHIEGSQPYFKNGSITEIDPLTYRHREMVYELIRKNILTADEPLANLNSNVIKRSLHPALLNAKQKQIRIMYPYFGRNTEELRKGFMAATNVFEPYSGYSFARLAYGSDWNGYCFPKTPFGWISIVPPEVNLNKEGLEILTDGELIFLNGSWQKAEKSVGKVNQLLQAGIPDIQFEAPGSCIVVRGPIDPEKKQYRIFLLDPKYLGPVGVTTELKVKGAKLESVKDACTDKSIPVTENSCPVKIEKGAFRILNVYIRR